ncbi:hypothetical protein KC19_1G152700 [Ceratodon purpureus]|uniref:Uncharacterized protein n=1 Tax=Ceratodon purpureus TaxID=3225 RepID=A0A8T0J6G8_CERPU|nr:hypothetical protein KC19_1G152700 [Ceratodon purpureus]KAG0591136.1 hypothetical protein KC19_1G152700 [Ceratodon purpureus]
MVAMAVSRVLEEDDEDDDVADLFDDEFLEHMESLKQACQMMPGAEVRLKTSTLASSKFEEEDDEEDGDGYGEVDDDDDDALLLSIERRFLGKGVLGGKAGGKDRNAGGKNGDLGKGGAIGKRTSGAEVSGVVQLGRTVSVPARGGGQGGEDDEDDEDEDLLRSVKESCGALDLVKASKHTKTCFPDVEADFVEDVQPLSSLDDVLGSSGNGDTVYDPQPICSFLPAQLDDDEFDESPLPLVVHDPSSASDGAKAQVPESVQAVTEALLKNRICQQSLREVLRQVESKLEENREMQRRAVSLVEYQKACTRKFCGFTEVANSSVELIATKPASKRKGGEFKVKGPPENPDVEVFRRLQSQLPAEFNVKKWTKKETQALVKGVRQQLQEIRVRAMMESWDSDEEDQDFDEQMRNIGESEEELKKGSSSIDWSSVARIYVSGRSSWECKLQWENNEDPLLNHKPWTKAEDKKLLSTVQAHDMVEWAAIAEELGTQRTPAQCAIRYQRSLNASILRSNWTPEEDEQLQAAVEKFGEKDWQTVAACMEGRLGSQCMSRWTKVLHPDRHRRGRWLAEEDTRLKWAVSVYGPRGWKNIAAHVPGRSDVQCRERWCNVLDPSVKIDEWTPDEDAKLEELVDKYGRHRWAAVGAELGRTDNQCFRHWKLLHPEHKISFKKDMVILRAALATNFVGREKERPDLGFQDFLPPSGVGEGGNRRALPPSRPNTSKEKGAPKSRKKPSRPNTSKEKAAPKPRKRPSKKTSPVPCSEVNENQVVEPCSEVNDNQAMELCSEVNENQVVEPCSEVNDNQAMELCSEVTENQVVELCSEVNESQVVEVYSRKRRAPQPGARASKKRKIPEPPPVVIENHDGTVEATRDSKDAPLIVYTRRKDRFSSSCGKSSLDNTGASELNAVGNEISSAGQGERGNGAGTFAASEEPTLRRYRKKLTLPN